MQVGGEFGAVAVGRRRDGAALGEEFGDLLAFAHQRYQRPVAFFGEVAEHLVLGGEDPEHLFQFPQRRVGAVQHGVKVAAATGEAGAEFVEDDRQPLVLGQMPDVAEQVHADRAGGVGHRQQILAGAFVPGGDLVQRRRQRRPFRARLGG